MVTASGSVPKIFSRRTLGVFEDASASIPIRQIDRAFEGVDIRLGEDPGGPDGARRAQFRHYIVSVDQHDPQQLDRLGGCISLQTKVLRTPSAEQRSWSNLFVGPFCTLSASRPLGKQLTSSVSPKRRSKPSSSFRRASAMRKKTPPSSVDVYSS